MKCSALFRLGAGRPRVAPTTAASATAVAVCHSAGLPPNYSNIPYKKHDRIGGGAGPKRRSAQRRDGGASSTAEATATASASSVMQRQRMAPLQFTAVLPSSMRTNTIDPSSSSTATSFNSNHRIRSYRAKVCSAADLSMRPLLLLHGHAAGAPVGAGVERRATIVQPQLHQQSNRSSFGELLEQLSCRWAAKFYGNVTFGPRNYPYPSSRWLARRFKMKKHRIIKRFRFRRYKLAAVANLPFARMIRVGMLPELKSSKTKKGDAVEASLSSQLVDAARSSSATGGKAKGKRTRPKSKYQV